jgi:predicted ArsR family transcriptional regulator
MANQPHPQPSAIDLLTDSRRSLIQALKRTGWATIPALAQMLSISTEAVRQQLSYLQREGWITTDCAPDADDERVPGRPPVEYCLTPAADDLFPKDYATLAVTLFDALGRPERELAEITDERVASMQLALLERGPAALRSIYRPDDPYTDIDEDAAGFRLIERNCPYLQFATERPLFCSTTVSALRRLTKREVVREERFQDGDGRCVFHVFANAPIGRAREERRFEAEPAKNKQPDPVLGPRTTRTPGG